MNQKPEEHFIRNVNIKNYKCFEDFEADGFERVNLVGGMNNVGKTALLEALFINSHAKNLKTFLASLKTVNFIRYQMNIFLDTMLGKHDGITEWKKGIEHLSGFLLATNINISMLTHKEEGIAKKYVAVLNSNKLEFLLSDITKESYESISNIEFLDQHGKTSTGLKSSYAAIQEKDNEKWLNSQLNYFEKDVDAFKFIGDVPSCHKISIDKYLDIHEFGDGLKSFISILCDLHKCQDGYLFIDEVDNGIHYSKFDQLWELILTVSKETNCQIFASTHSKECIEAYHRVIKKVNESRATFTGLGKNQKGEIRAIVMDSKRFMEEIENENEVRGW